MGIRPGSQVSSPLARDLRSSLAEAFSENHYWYWFEEVLGIKACSSQEDSKQEHERLRNLAAHLIEMSNNLPHLMRDADALTGEITNILNCARIEPIPSVTPEELENKKSKAGLHTTSVRHS